ncbi:Chaperone protein DnaJ [Morus notabilis]|uniref:Chaperone protein DnaJ n=1 Tax=Morus notabilis TaxID=981085 RepID=W9SB15_9ROSA|nr:Chaperone protein DnaJ [Morus notabilis]
MPTPCLPLHTPLAASTRITKLSNLNSNFLANSHGKYSKINGIGNNKSVPCRARASSSSSSSSSFTDFDLYDLLGIDSSSDQSQIKNAYRSLQKRCHPDIAGPAGHDMAIILNEAYALLSNPSHRSAYDKVGACFCRYVIWLVGFSVPVVDVLISNFFMELQFDYGNTLVKEQAKTAELRGYTGKPIYSAWLGSENEERAVFVDEVKCVGCLKCALFAQKTFAIESVYGRARVVAQWADPEFKIQDAIGACPVDCISMVERSNLAALEFLMSKQPRGNVRVGMGNAAGARVSNIFADVKKFQIRYQEAREKASSQYSKEADLQKAARMSAIQAIRSISNWFYWQTPNSVGSTVPSNQSLIITNHKPSEPDIGKLRDAAAARKKLEREGSGPVKRTPSKNYLCREDYWIPLTHALPAPSTQNNSYSRTISDASPPKERKRKTDRDRTVTKNNERNPISFVTPLATAMIAASIVRVHGEGAVGRLDEHVGGSLALQIVNSSWLPVILTGITWYIVGTFAVGFVEAIRSREVEERKK